MNLDLFPGDLLEFINSIAVGFNSLAEKKQINYQIITEQNSDNDRFQLFDSDKVDKIITNLLSNAFKFTPDKGEIKIKISLSDLNPEELRSIATNDTCYLTIIVEDTGIGIPRDKIDKIFERFYKVENTHKRVSEGTGIGLALVKELIDLQKGSVYVESEEGKGSRFTVRLPVGKPDALAIEKLANQLANGSLQEAEQQNSMIVSNAFSDSPAAPKESPDEKSPLILLVEDNLDMRSYIRSIIDVKYRVIEAENGLLGMNLATDVLPDVIISDIMMPEMDGYELTNKLKNDQRTSHIPVILLTARSSVENIIKGLEYEADDYITKPFNEQILLLTVKNLILSRQKLMKLYSAHIENSTSKRTGVELEPQQPDIPDHERKFLDKLMIIVENNLSDPEFDLQKFSAEIGMEASVFHRKLKAIINQSPGDFLRSMRMKRGAQLLADKNLPINEIAFMVGFGNNPNYFSTAFRKYFGKTPSEYQDSLNESFL
jgi:DNA-binding response OmpR family regulator/anti-sigma regulatory factor (Ser/Thr protein kinase)